MKQPTITRIRTALLLVLAVGEVVGLVQFFAKRSFFPFVILSLVGIFLTVPMLRIGLLSECVDRGYEIPLAIVDSTFSIFLSRLAFPLLARGLDTFSLVLAGISIYFAAVVLFNLLFLRGGPIAKDAAAFFGYAAFLSWDCVLSKSVLLNIFAALPLLWFAWRVRFYIRNRHRLSVDANDSSDAITNLGGRA